MTVDTLGVYVIVGVALLAFNVHKNPSMGVFVDVIT